ncbi:uncharacterized protein EMH_0030350 [Eimeria mitis]|uniref:Transmembrane protein n=1 Tax=Eimeria mitis TaxID=44415 RepID=U6JYR9_9EIME|nr:uncharacterized protein EMH_0030350 [Eimeria mitis]CDJ30635.1 hypothetical protein, conserved [Eimeria mitis]
MTSAGGPYVEDGSPPVGIVDMGIAPNSTQKTIYDYSFSSGCRQYPFKKRFCRPRFVYLLAITLTSLATVYFVVSCFGFIRARPEIVGLSRLLAAAGDRPCQEGTNAGEDNGQAFNDGGFEGASGEGDGAQLQADDDTPPKGTTTQRLQLATATPGLFEMPSQLTAPEERDTAAAAAGFSTDSRHQGHFAVDLQGGPKSQEGQAMYGSEAGGTMEPFFGGPDGGEHDGGVLGVEPERELRGEVLEMWEQRGLPGYVRQEVQNLFVRLVDVASSCRRLLRAVDPATGLRLTHEVVRLLGLDLGAISLIRNDLEPFRSMLGDALVELGLDALQLTGENVGLEEQRTDIGKLIRVMKELKAPRPFTENITGKRYKDATLSILRTAEVVENFCRRVLEGLLRSAGLAEGLGQIEFEQQMRVLKALYRVHSNHIARDGSLRYYIVLIQRQLGESPLLMPHHRTMAIQQVPPLVNLVEEIIEAVRNSGGQLLQPQVDQPHHHGSPRSLLPTTVPRLPSPAQSHELPGRAQQQQGIERGSLPFLAPAGSAALGTPETTANPVSAPYAQRPASPLGHRKPHSSASSLEHFGANLEALQTLPPSPPFSPWGAGAHASSQGLQDTPSQFPQTPTYTSSAAVQSHQAASERFAPFEAQLPAWFVGQRTIPVAASAAHYDLAPFIGRGGYRLQASPSAFSESERGHPLTSTRPQVQDIQRTPAAPPWTTSSKSESPSFDGPKGFEDAGASASEGSRLRAPHAHFSHGDEAASYPGPSPPISDLPGAFSSVEQHQDSLRSEYSLFGQFSQPPWFPFSVAPAGQPLIRASGETRAPKPETAIGQSEDEGSLAGNVPFEHLSLNDGIARGGERSTEK